MANSGPGWEGVDAAWERLEDETREAQRRALESGDPP